MATMEKAVILIIDDDPDIRSSTRIMLEAAGFSVGEAATAEEGLKTADRIKPDAIIVDLMMESIDAGSRLSQTLAAQGFGGPVYLLSSAGDSVRLNLDPREMGLAGIFQKPIDHAVLVSTLKRKLHLG
jgi:two-component system, chemotaxis family, chemotaxis protein CheY